MAGGFAQTHPMVVQLAGSGDGAQYEGLLYGGVPGRYLIAGGFGEAFEVGQELIVKTTIGGHVVGFWAKVEVCVAAAEEIYLISYPEQVERLDLRRSQRMNVFIPARVEIAAENGHSGKAMRFEGVLVNLSGEGCCLSSEGNLPDNLQCRLTFSLPGDDGSFLLTGNVTRTRVGEAPGTVTQAGVEFGGDKDNAAALHQIRAWISANKQYVAA